MMDPSFEYEKLESPFVPMDCEMDWLSGLPSHAKPENANTSLPLKVPAEVAAWRLREMHYSTMSLMHGFSHLDGNGKGNVPQPNNNETIDHWMQTTLNVTQASRDFRLPISPEYAAAGRSGFDYIRDHLGYRLELRSAVLPRKLSFAAAGENATFSFEAALINWGFAAPISPRPVQLVVLGSNGTVLWRSVSLADPRDWQPFVPGDPTFLPLLHRLAAAISIPSSALQCPVGQVCAFSFGLAMPDMRMEKVVAEGPGGGEAYCIRLANDAVPWLQGVNVLAEFNVSYGDDQLSTAPSRGSRLKTDDDATAGTAAPPGNLTCVGRLSRPGKPDIFVWEDLHGRAGPISFFAADNATLLEKVAKRDVDAGQAEATTDGSNATCCGHGFTLEQLTSAGPDLLGKALLAAAGADDPDEAAVAAALPPFIAGRQQVAAFVGSRKGPAYPLTRSGEPAMQVGFSHPWGWPGGPIAGPQIGNNQFGNRLVCTNPATAGVVGGYMPILRWTFNETAAACGAGPHPTGCCPGVDDSVIFDVTVLGELDPPSAVHQSVWWRYL